jgi:nicotinamidase-related amidase
MKGKVKTRVKFVFSVVALLVGNGLFISLSPAFAQTIVDEWPTVQAPKAPELKPVTIDPKVTALLILDIVKPICNAERTPRCVSSLPKLQGLVHQARAKGVSVVYSLGGRATPADIWKEVAPREGEPIVESGSDKFFKTDLEKILKEKGVKTLIVVGTWANGGVLYTSTGAVMRGFQVIVPVDGMSAPSAYIEQYTTSHFASSPATRGVILTKIDMIQF